MTEAMHTCARGGCERQIPTSAPICERCREQLNETKQGKKLVESIDHEFLRRQQGQRNAPLKFAEAVSEATALLIDGPPRKPAGKR